MCRCNGKSCLDLTDFSDLLKLHFPLNKSSTLDHSPDSISSLSSSSYTARDVTSIQWTPNSIMESSLTSALTQLRLSGNSSGLLGL